MYFPLDTFFSWQATTLTDTKLILNLFILAPYNGLRGTLVWFYPKIARMLEAYCEVFDQEVRNVSYFEGEVYGTALRLYAVLDIHLTKITTSIDKFPFLKQEVV